LTESTHFGQFTNPIFASVLPSGHFGQLARPLVAATPLAHLGQFDLFASASVTPSAHLTRSKSKQGMFLYNVKNL
jgi:hypothetical protein